MKPPLSHLPLLPLTIAVAVGIVMGRWTGWEWAIIPAIISLCGFILKRQTIAITALGCLLGITTMKMGVSDPLTLPLDGESTIWHGVVEQARESESGNMAIANINYSTESTGIASFKPFRCQLIIPSTLPPIAAGDSIAFQSTINPLEISADLPDEFSLEEYYFTNGISATAFVPQPDITITGKANGLKWGLRRWKESLSNRILQSDLNQDCARFLSATLLGTRDLLDTDIKDQFTSAGIAHVLALSGMHVGIIALVSTILLFPLTAWRGRRLTSWILLVILWGYAVMTGLEPSIVRATIMTSLIVGAYMLQRSHSSGNALCCAALIIIMADPRALFSVSFQLSFTAVAAILAFIWWSNQLEIQKPWVRKIIQIMGVPIAATMGTGTISAFYFHQFPLYFLISNIPVVFILPFFVGGGILLLLISALFSGSEPSWLIASLDGIYELIEWIASTTSQLPVATIEGIYINPWIITAWMFALLLFGIWAYNRRIVWGYLAGACMICSIILIIVCAPRPSDKEYYITRESYHTNIVVNNTDRLTIYTTLAQRDNDEVIRECQLRYRNYMGLRAIDSIEVINLPNDCVMEVLSDKIRVVNTTTYDSITQPLDYILVCHGFKGDIKRLASYSPADSILLSNDINARRRSRYLRELMEANIPARSLSTHALHRN